MTNLVVIYIYINICQYSQVSGTILLIYPNDIAGLYTHSMLISWDINRI